MEKKLRWWRAVVPGQRTWYSSKTKSLETLMIWNSEKEKTKVEECTDNLPEELVLLLTGVLPCRVSQLKTWFTVETRTK